MKKLLNGIICAILIVMIIGIGTSTVRTITKNQKRPGSSADSSCGTSEELPDGTYRISYKVAGSGEDLTERFSWLMKSDGSYPKSYESAEGARISGLCGAVDYISWESFEGAYTFSPVYDPTDCDHWAYFFAWFLDSECTEEFGGEIYAGTEGDVILYAKIGEDWESNWTNFY